MRISVPRREWTATPGDGGTTRPLLNELSFLFIVFWAVWANFQCMEVICFQCMKVVASGTQNKLSELMNEPPIGPPKKLTFINVNLTKLLSSYESKPDTDGGAESLRTFIG